MNWKEIFEYQDGDLIWKINSGVNKVKGKKAGALSNGYLRFKYNGKKYLNHRVIFEMHHGYCPEFIDHINRNRSDNKINNLRQATHSINAFNRETWIKRNLPRGVYEVKNRYISKVGSIYLGSFDNIKEALEVRNSKIKLLYP